MKRRTFIRWFGGDSDLEWFSDLGHAVAPPVTRRFGIVVHTCALVQGDPSLMVTTVCIKETCILKFYVRVTSLFASGRLT